MRIVNAKKSKYYAAALSNFERARRRSERARLVAEWEETERQVRACHHRKIGFLSGFESMASDSGRVGQSAFPERTKAR